MNRCVLIRVHRHALAHTDAHTLSFICDFSSSGLLMAFIMAALFCWHVQHKSVRGLEITIFGKSLRQYVQNVEYFTARWLARVDDSS